MADCLAQCAACFNATLDIVEHGSTSQRMDIIVAVTVAIVGLLGGVWQALLKIQKVQEWFGLANVDKKNAIAEIRQNVATVAAAHAPVAPPSA